MGRRRAASSAPLALMPPPACPSVLGRAELLVELHWLRSVRRRLPCAHRRSLCLRQTMTAFAPASRPSSSTSEASASPNYPRDSRSGELRRSFRRRHARIPPQFREALCHGCWPGTSGSRSDSGPWSRTSQRLGVLRRTRSYSGSRRAASNGGHTNAQGGTADSRALVAEAHRAVACAWYTIRCSSRGAALRRGRRDPGPVGDVASRVGEVWSRCRRFNNRNGRAARNARGIRARCAGARRRRVRHRRTPNPGPWWRADPRPPRCTIPGHAEHEAVWRG